MISKQYNTTRISSARTFLLKNQIVGTSNFRSILKLNPLSPKVSGRDHITKKTPKNP